MAYDIYGNNLRIGYCEVHPQVNEEYPCSLCYADGKIREQHNTELTKYYKIQEEEYYKSMRDESAKEKLIAAAPDLLAALIELDEKWASSIEHYNGSATNDRVIEAIKKATEI